MRYEIRELNIGGILDQAIAVTKDNLWLLVKIVLILFVPFTLVSSWMVISSISAIQAGEPASMFFAGGLGLLNGLVVYPLTNAAMIYAIASCYLNRPITLGLAFRRAFGVFLRLLGTMLLFGLVLVLVSMVMGILMAFLKPPLLGVLVGIVLAAFLLVFALRYLLTFQVVVLEGLSGPSAFRRSSQLMKGNIGAGMALGILVLVIGWAVGGMQNFIPQIYVRLIIASVMQGLIFIFGAAAWVVFYFSCRAKAEHFDLALLADAVGTDDAPQVPILDASSGEAH